MQYAAVLFAPDGDWTVDYRCDTIEEVQDKLADQGSRWYFYPFHAVIRAHSISRGTLRLVDVAEPFQEWKGTTINRFARMLTECDADFLEGILS